jgi:hypothetical protein
MERLFVTSCHEFVVIILLPTCWLRANDIRFVGITCSKSIGLLVLETR